MTTKIYNTLNMPHFAKFLNQRLFAFSTLSILIALPIIYFLYQWQIETARNQEFQFYKANLTEKVDVLIQEKQSTTHALAVAMTSPPNFKEALLNDDKSIQSELERYSQRLKTLTKYKGIWIQLIDKNGISIARSWTKKHGDDLSEVRQDVAALIHNPQRMNNFSVGKFALTFKSMVPLFDDNDKFIGLVDVISQINSIDHSLAETNGVRSVVLVNKRYRKQLTNAFTGKFIDDYYVANSDADTRDMALINKFGVEKIFSSSNYVLFENQLMVTRPIYDIHGQPMATWVTIKSLNDFPFVNVQKTQRQFIVITVFIFALLLMLLAMMYFKRQAEFEKRFFFEVFDTSTEIVYVSNQRRILFANKRFFEFFNEFETLDEFHKKHHCICELFVPEEGFLKRHMNGVYWFNHVVQNKHEPHYAKVQVNGKEYVFLVKATEISNANGEQYVSVLMTDITEEERYKSQLEHLIIHDELTGIYNRHYFNRTLEQEIKRHHRYQSPLSMAFLDIDHFKKINDSYGHDVGDAVLLSIAKSISSLLRSSDVLCRVGGEEFVVIMPETSLENALIISERIRTSVEQISSKEVPEKITISLGLVELHDWDNLQSFYKRADEALYKAKEKGRNRIETQAEE
ncbi:diguanylate cyclase [Hydrogenovibrio sp. 3SP14C1]|uniref:sensor domain-containing diguanylate cyclase n=1 Tax=Hydrogenovibrio sp. 3SP14C1 TaxID=3038774 RepID=UPI00241759EA|nr:diguanylate cyclase [Hydrogenovibrio sp. 3SP14C1]MDG4812645.1 diguanylate cyclase [Hydrogenovibrio sp. 3SP14C1]